MPPSTIDCSFIIPTHNRCNVLRETLTRLDTLTDNARTETIVIDNGSTDTTLRLRDDFPDVRWIELGTNLGCAARNVGAVAARGEVLLMLDDDSRPEHGTIDRIITRFAREVDLGAAACRVRLTTPPHRHDAGGVPGIFFNCGGAIRRVAFLDAGGFPIDYDYYVEEYDLACRLLRRGWRIEPLGDCLVWHGRVTTNRDNNRMLRLLVRNNLRLWRRYAPDDQLDAMIAETLDRYERVARKENALDGFHAGRDEADAESARQQLRRIPLSAAQFDALFGLPRARELLDDAVRRCCLRNVAVWHRGKGCEQLMELLKSRKIAIHAVHDRDAAQEPWHDAPVLAEDQFDPARVDGVLIGSLSPGVAEDLRDELAARFAPLPILSLAPWADAPARAAAREPVELVAS